MPGRGSHEAGFQTDPRRGAALFIVLMFAALLAFLAAAVMKTGVSGARAAQVFADAARADALGASAGDIVVYQLMTGNADTHRGGSLSVRLPGAEITIDYVSESARVDVNTGSIKLISAVLAAAGCEPPLIASVAARIQASRAAFAGRRIAAEPASDPTTPPGTLEQPKPVPQSATPIEVAGTWGLPDDILRRIVPMLTVASGSKGVDPILADRTVLAALLGGDDERVDDYIERRSRGFVNSASALELLPVPAQTMVDFEDSQAVRATARVSIAGRFQRRYAMVVAAPAGSAQRPVVIEWRKVL